MCEALVGCTTDRELHPAPKVLFGYWNYISVRLNNALDRADAHTLGRIVVTFAFDTGFLIDHIQNAVAFANGLGWTFGYACATGDAVFKNFHSHGSFSVKRFVADINYRHAIPCVN